MAHSNILLSFILEPLTQFTINMLSIITHYICKVKRKDVLNTFLVRWARASIHTRTRLEGLANDGFKLGRVSAARVAEVDFVVMPVGVF